MTTTNTTRTMAEIIRAALIAADDRCRSPRREVASDVTSNRLAVDGVLELMSFATSPARAAMEELLDDSPVGREPLEGRAHMAFADAATPVRFDPSIARAYLEDLAIAEALERVRREISALRSLSGAAIAARVNARGVGVRFVAAEYDGVDL